MKDFFSNFFTKIYEVKIFWPLLIVMFSISTLDLIGLGGKHDFGAGWVISFLYFFTWVAYNIFKKPE